MSYRKLKKISWDEVPRRSKEKLVPLPNGDHAIELPEYIEVVYMLGKREQKSRSYSSRVNGQYEYEVTWIQRKTDADSGIQKDFDSVIAYLLDDKGKRKAIIGERTDLRLPD